MEDIKEKTADEMFKELGYEIIEHSKTTLNYEKEGIYMDKEIIFELLDESITTGYGTGECCHISMQELQAINKKCKELRMDIVVSKKYKIRLKLKPDFEEYLNAIYDCYVLEKDENLDKGARELKYSYMYVIDNMILHDCLEEIKS